MLTLPDGNVYGKDLGSLVMPETERLSEKNKVCSMIYAAYQKILEQNIFKIEWKTSVGNAKNNQENIRKETVKTENRDIGFIAEEQETKA